MLPIFVCLLWISPVGHQNVLHDMTRYNYYNLLKKLLQLVLIYENLVGTRITPPN